MQLKLTDKHLHKLSLITGMPLEQITKLSAMSLIDESKAMDLLIKYDWNLLRKNPSKYTAEQRISALENEYNVSVAKIRGAIYTKPKKVYYCYGCGQVISRVIFKRNNGLCDHCVVKSIKL